MYFSQEEKGNVIEQRDCVVRSIATAFNINYRKAHAHCKELGREDNRGFNMQTALNRKQGNSSWFLFDKFVQYYHLEKRITLGTFIKKYSTGTYIMRVYRHALVIQDGKILDSTNPNSRIKEYFKILDKLI